MELGTFRFESGAMLPNLQLAFETFGHLNAAKDNAILVCHALTGDSHAAGEDPSGWWSGLVGPGKGIDTNRYFVICSNVLGGCGGSSGPSSQRPDVGVPYGMRFPIVTIRDMVHAQKRLLDRLGIPVLQAVIGGSMGGMQVLEWGILYPGFVRLLFPVATTAALSPMGIAYNDIARQAILADPNWQQGDYYGSSEPAKGLSIARMVGMVTYRTAELFEQRFQRQVRHGELFSHDHTFEVESYLRYQGEKLVHRFDANSYLYLLKSMDTHDIARGRGGLRQALSRIAARTCLIGIRQDLLYPLDHLEQLRRLLCSLGKEAELHEIDSPFGHDAFLVEFEAMGDIVSQALATLP